MGTFVFTLGNLTIAPEKKEAFLADARRVLDQGGLFRLNHTSAFGKELYLLDFPSFEPNEKGARAAFQWSYFDDDWWEPAGIVLNECRPYSGKIGWARFNTTIQALYYLAEIYSETPFISYTDFYSIPITAIMWLRYVLDRDVQFTWRRNVWRSYEMHALQDKENGLIPNEPGPHSDPRGYFESDTYDTISHASYILVCSDLKKGIKEQNENMPGINLFKPLRYFHVISAIDGAIEKYRSSSEQTEEEQVQFLLELLTTDEDRRKEICDEKKLDDILYKIDLATPPVYVKLISENYHMSFWTLWFRVRDHIAQDIQEFYNGIWEQEYDTRRLSTERFMNVSSDDRLYWWREDGDVAISQEMEDWLGQVAARHRVLCSEAEAQPDISAWQRRFVIQLAGNNKCLFFEQPFYEFLGNFHRPEYQAAERLLEENADDFKNYKRLVAVYANYALRKKVFGF